MIKREDKDFLLESLPFKLEQTARVGELIGRNYYKENLKGQKEILEIDEFVILSYLKKYPKASQAEISKFFLKGKAHIGKILNNMEQKGYIQRSVKLENGNRIKHSKLTPLGERNYQNTDDKFGMLAIKTLECLTKEEIELFTKLLDKYKQLLLNNFDISF